MTDCSSSMHDSTSSSDVNSTSRSCDSRVRAIKLVRPHSNAGRSKVLGSVTSTYGFSLRGGREFGTGFFVSHVMKGSEADLKDLRVGDQIIRVNSYQVDDAVHRELSQFISTQDRLTLKVRGVGIIPVKEKASDPLTWHVVPLKQCKSYDRIDDVSIRDVQVVLNVAPRTKLGCGICKGPDWKPGIFIQFTKENGVARESGLRPGDQLLSCNGVDFLDILFSDAVAIMKSSSVLELMVRTGIGMDLFPGESSGYNSSASSVTGDQSPCWGDQASKRLSIVREESGSSYDRLGTFIRPKGDLDRRKDKLLAVAAPKVPSAYEQAKNVKNNTTIISLSENGTLINNTLIPNIQTMSNNKFRENVTIRENQQTTHSESNYSTRQNPSDKIANICFVSKQNETKIVTVEVHRQNSSAMPPPPPAFDSCQTHKRSSSLSSSIISSEANESNSSLSPQPSLSSAISEELKRRAQKKSSESSSSPPSQIPVKKPLVNPLGGGNEQHSALMDEFKKAHLKMFKNGFVENEKGTKDELKPRSELEIKFERQQEQKKLAKDETDKAPAATNTISLNGLAAALNQNTSSITPHPVLNGTNGNSGQNGNNGTLAIKKKANPPPPPPQKIVKQVSLPVGLIDKPPHTPAPDYDSIISLNDLNGQENGQQFQNVQQIQQFHKRNGHIPHNEGPNGISPQIKGTMGRVAASEMQKANGNAAEMESIESFKMTHPASPVPHPPPVYFSERRSGPPTMKKIQRPISVIVGEYGNANRKEPTKFDFIEGRDDHLGNKNGEDVGVRLKNELEQTLSRSNLRMRNEMNDYRDDSSSPRSSISSNGSTTVQITQPKPILKTQTNIDKLSSMLAIHHQRVKDLNNNCSENGKEMRKDLPLNGILKSNTNTVKSTKNISFGDVR